MCAIFGYIATANRRPDLKQIAEIVAANIARGPHAFGLAWINSAGRLRCYKQSGRMTDHLGILALARDAVALVGHLRYATHGSPGENINNHPHPSDGGWIVHNGIVANYNRLVRENDLHTVSACDSEAIAQLIEQSDGSLLNRCTEATEQTTGNLAVMGLWARPLSLAVIRRGNPLHCADTSRGLYIATCADGLPGQAKIVRDNTARIYTRDKKGQHHGKIQTITTQQAADVSSIARGTRFFDCRSETAEYRGG